MDLPLEGRISGPTTGFGVTVPGRQGIRAMRDSIPLAGAPTSIETSPRGLVFFCSALFLLVVSRQRRGPCSPDRKEGPSLLQGLVMCGVCRRILASARRRTDISFLADRRSVARRFLTENAAARLGQPPVGLVECSFTEENWVPFGSGGSGGSTLGPILARWAKVTETGILT